MAPHVFYTPVIRYSPRPIDQYRAGNSTREWGPATSSMLKLPAAWNLAYLSHDFEKSLLHPDPNFTVNVRRTIQHRLDGSGADMTDADHVSRRVESLFLMPAPRAVHLLLEHPIVFKLPMYEVYGDLWIKTIRQRSYLCQADESPPDNVVDFTQAKALINRVK